MRGPPIIIVPSSQRMEKQILQAFLLLCNTRGLSCSACFFAGVAPLLLFACAALIGSGVWGLKTNLEYAQDPQKAEKHLLIQYTIITVINSFAAFLETPNIIAKPIMKVEYGRIMGMNLTNL